MGEKFIDLEEFKDEVRVALTLEQWQTLWEIHNYPNDKNSNLKKDIKVTYNVDKRDVIIFIPSNPEACGTKNHKKGYYGIAIQQNNKAIQAVFQHLKKGENRFIVRSGLKVLKEGELSDFFDF